MSTSIKLHRTNFGKAVLGNRSAQLRLAYALEQSHASNDLLLAYAWAKVYGGTEGYNMQERIKLAIANNREIKKAEMLANQLNNIVLLLSENADEYHNVA